ncbi:MAG: hypothetical protein IKU94_08060 [Bacteroidaceae bacterium]|nr:hypothetical protein [Bacteroidaceae bacterium]
MGQFKVLDKESSEGNPGDQRYARYYDMLTWGQVSGPPKLSIREKGNTRRCNFSVRWKKHTFINCVVIEKESPDAYAAAAALRGGEWVLIAGRMREFSYTPTKGKHAGEQLQGQDAKIDFLAPQRASAVVMEKLAELEPPDEMEASDFESETGDMEW